MVHEEEYLDFLFQHEDVLFLTLSGGEKKGLEDCNVWNRQSVKRPGRIRHIVPKCVFGYVYSSRLLNKPHKILSLCKLIEQQWCRQGQRLFISGWSPDRTWCQMQTSPWLAALCAIGKSLMFGWEDRAAAKWMLGALPGIKLMNLTAASGHHDTNTAWVVTHAQHGVSGSGTNPSEQQKRLQTPRVSSYCTF